MATPNMAAGQLLELLLTLKKTTPTAARSILNNQPTIAYALITLMVSMNAVNIEVFQKTLAEYGAAASAPAPAPLMPPQQSVVPQILPPPVAPAPVSAVPPHLHAQYRNTTPTSTPPGVPTHTPTPPYGYAATPPGLGGNSANGYGHAQRGYGQQGYGYQLPQAGYSGYQAGPGQHQPPLQVPVHSSTPALPDALANIPAEQKALIMRVLAMTPEQISLLPPAERATYIQIRTTLGVPSG